MCHAANACDNPTSTTHQGRSFQFMVGFVGGVADFATTTTPTLLDQLYNEHVMRPNEQVNLNITS